MSTRQTTEHFSTWHQSISNELGPREVDGVSGCCWSMAFCFHSRVLGVALTDVSDELYLLTVVFGSVLEPRWWYPLHIDVGFLMQCRLRDRRSRAFKVGFRPCRLHAVISPDSLNLLMILWTVDDEIPKFLAMVRWGTLFLNTEAGPMWVFSIHSFFHSAIFNHHGNRIYHLKVLKLSYIFITCFKMPLLLRQHHSLFRNIGGQNKQKLTFSAFWKTTDYTNQGNVRVLFTARVQWTKCIVDSESKKPQYSLSTQKQKTFFSEKKY